ncbi:MAG TPA: winged helix-turn-helix domain-containing protein, partial [Terriglobales bacterium]
MSTASTSHEIRFSEYTIDLRTGELRRNGDLLKLQPQPAKVLSILVSRVGEVVTRRELAEQVWGSETYVDFEHGLNYAIRHIRSVLEDDPESPQFLETIPKRGYRFIATINNPLMTEQVQPQVVRPEKTPSSRVVGSKIRYAVAGVVLAAIIGLTWYVRSSRVGRASASQIRSLAVLPLRNLSNDPNQEYFTDGITDELITDLARADGLRVISR